MALIPSGFRRGALRLTQLPFTDGDLVEPARPWLQTPPEIVAYTREDEGQPWSPPRSADTLHATYDTSRDDVVLFGPNHMIDERGGWTLEAERRPEQYVDFYRSDNYKHIFKGAKPAISRDVEPPGFSISLGAVHDSEIIHFDRPVFLATPMEPDNWGRWLSTVVPKVLRYTRSNLRPRYSVLCRSSKTWQRELLRFLGAGPEHVIEHDPGRTYFCPRVITTTYSAADITPAVSEMAIYREIADRCSGGKPRAGSRIFVSRAGRSAQAPGYRVLTNEAELTAKLVNLGFDVIEPETLSFQEQVVRFSSADFVVGLGGAGMFNVLFCKPNTRVLTIESGTVFIGGHSRMFAAAGLRYGIVFGCPDDTDLASIHKRWSVDTDKVIRAIKGFA